MKKLFFLLAAIILLTACAPSPEQIQKAMTQTQAAIPTPTPTPTPTPGLSIEQIKLLADLKQDLDQIDQEIDNALC